MGNRELAFCFGFISLSFFFFFANVISVKRSKNNIKKIWTKFYNKFVGHMPKMRQTGCEKIKKCLKLDIEWLCPEPFNLKLIFSSTKLQSNI